MILAIIISTMIAVAVVVGAMQYYAYRKNHVNPHSACARKASAAGAQETPIAS